MSGLVGQSLGRYHILEQLGEGGMASVYKAFDTRLERNVAIKVILPSHEQSEQFLKRFDRESKALAHLSHPNIVKVLDYGQQDGIPYLVMEYIPGGTLKQKLGQPIRWQEASRMLIPVARALQYAHQENIIHRDVKPANILLTHSGEPMLSDFGIAKLLEKEESLHLTGTGVGIGTPEYMAPEQGMGQKIDHRADIYALGIVFYEMITGRKPYQADTPMAVMLKKVTDPLPRPKQFMPSLPDAVENVLLKALAKDPQDRYLDMDAFANALENLSTLEKSKAKEEATVVIPEEKAALALKESPVEHKSFAWWPWAVAFGVVACLAVAVIVIALITKGGFPAGSGEKPTVILSPTSNIQSSTESSPTLLVTQVSVLTDTPYPTFTSLPTAASISTADGAELILVPAGEFIMGSNSNEPYFWGAESPRHTVSLDSFLIYRNEVTNDMYRACVDAKACPQPAQIYSRTRSDYFTNPQYGNYPVIYVSYFDATAYCKWANARLPTEAEWEKAARGTDGRLFPWGGDELKASYANFCDVGCPNTDPAEIESQLDDGYRDTAPVGSFPAGISPYGALDMAGNVLEWTFDWMGSYSSASGIQNPTGPGTGDRRVMRGGSWYSGRAGLRVTARASKAPDLSYDTLGFRCAVDAP